MFAIPGMRSAYAKHIRWLVAFSLATNILILAVPIHILQVYSRVLRSGSEETLLYLTLIVIAALCLGAYSDYSRRLIARRLAHRYLIHNHGDLVHALVDDGNRSRSARKTIGKLRVVAGFISSRAFIGLFDLPFCLIFLVALTVLNVWLGVVALAGLFVMLALAVANNRATASLQARADDAEAEAYGFATSTLRNPEEIRAMGMAGSLQHRWKLKLLAAFGAGDAAAAKISAFAVAGTLARQIIQVAVISVGALLVLHQAMPGAVIFAAMIMTNRMLSPVDQTIGGWNGIMRAYRAHVALAALDAHERTDPPALPYRNLGALVVRGLCFAPDPKYPGKRVVDDVSFSLEPGTITVVTGAPGVGKSALAKLVAGARRPDSGCIEVGGIPLSSWADNQRAQLIGYVAQDITFCPVTVSENITRLRFDFDAEKLRQATRLASARDVVAALPDEYATVLERGDFRLTNRQKLPIAMARAYYDRPAFLVLDEPDADMARAEQKTLIGTLEGLKQDGVGILVISKRSRMRAAADTVLELSGGRLKRLSTPSQTDGKQRNRLPESEPVHVMMDEAVAADRAFEHLMSRQAKRGPDRRRNRLILDDGVTDRLRTV